MRSPGPTNAATLATAFSRRESVEQPAIAENGDAGGDLFAAAADGDLARRDEATLQSRSVRGGDVLEVADGAAAFVTAHNHAEVALLGRRRGRPRACHDHVAVDRGGRLGDQVVHVEDGR